MKSWGSVAAVVAAVLEDAVVEIERLEREADDEIAALAAQPPPAAPPECEVARMITERQITDAEQEQELIEFAAQLEERERWIGRVLELAHARLGPASPPDAERDRLAALIREGARHLPGSLCTVLVSPDVRPWLDENWTATVSRRAGKEVRLESGGDAGGCIVMSEDRRWSFDNSYRARSRRLEARWRAVLCRMYENAVSQSAAKVQAVSASMVGEQ